MLYLHRTNNQARQFFSVTKVNICANHGFKIQKKYNHLQLEFMLDICQSLTSDVFSLYQHNYLFTYLITKKNLLR